MARKKLKLYVWEDVLCDYTTGVAFALAGSPEEARELIFKKLGYKDEDLCISPRCVEKEEGFYVYGGG
jgi:hypothetical protein